MEKHIRAALQALGCDDKEIRLYIAAFLHGGASVPELTKTAKLQRSTAYLVMNIMLDKGLLLEDFKPYGKSITAVEPEVLLRMVAAKQRQIGRQKLLLEENLGGLQELYQSAETKPRVRSYQGINGLLSIWRDVLEDGSGEILLWTNQETESKLFSTEQHRQFIEQRMTRKLPMRVLAVSNPKGRALQAADAENLRTTKLLPAETDFSAETYLYGHKVAVLDYNRDIIGVITQSEQIAQAQRAIFETTWRLL